MRKGDKLRKRADMWRNGLSEEIEVVELDVWKDSVAIRDEDDVRYIMSFDMLAEYYERMESVEGMYIDQKEVKTRTINNVVATKDYSIFNKMQGNREVTINKKLEKSIAEKGIVEPIVVNENFEVINGQHRLAVAKKLGIEVPFIVRSGYSSEEMLDLNTTSKGWTFHDYINKYAVEGKKDYIKLQKLFEEYPITAAALTSVALNYAGSNGSVSKITKEGSFVFHNYEFLVSFLDFYKQVATSNIVKPSVNLFYVLYKLYCIKKFSPERFLKVQGAVAEKIKGVSAIDILTKKVLECYNRRLGEEKEIKYSETNKGFKIVEEYKKGMMPRGN